MKLAILIVTLLISISWSQELSTEDIRRITSDVRFNSTAEMAKNLIEHYPPESYRVIGLGRTTGVTGLWANEFADENYFQYAPVSKLTEVNKLTPSQQNQFWSKIIPSKSELGNKKLVIHRVLWTGHTANSTRESLLNYLKQTGHSLPLDFDFVGLDLQDVAPDPQGRIKPRLHRIDSNSYHEYLEDIDDDNNHHAGKRFTDIGAYQPQTPQEIIEGNGFTSDSKTEVILPIIEMGGCEEALSYF